MVDGRTGPAEHDGGCRIHVPQHIDDGVFPIVRGAGQCPILDIAMLALLAGGGDADRIPLVALCEGGDGLGNGGREHQGASTFRRGLEDELKILAEAQVEHLVGFVQHDHLHAGHVQGPAFDMILQTSGRPDHDMGTALQRPALGPHIHPADAGDHRGAGELVKPFQLTLHLKRQLPGRRHGQGKRCWRAFEMIGTVQQGGGHGQPEGHGLTRAGLRRDQGVGIAHLGRKNRLLNRGQRLISALGQCLTERRNNAFKFRHVISFGVPAIGRSGNAFPSVGSAAPRLERVI